MLTLDNNLFDEIQERAEQSERRRMHYDLRTQAFETEGAEPWQDMSQRMLNVMMVDTVIPVHRHTETNEVVCVLRGKGEERIFDGQGNLIESVLLEAGSDCSSVLVPRSAWHTFVPLVDGTVIFEAKDRPYDPVGTEEFLVLEK